MKHRWRPSPTLRLSLAAHVAAGLGALAAPSLWPLALGAVAANQALLIGAGMLPRNSLLGPNVTDRKSVV